MQPVWITPVGSLGTIPKNTAYSVQLEATVSTTEVIEYQLVSGSLPPGFSLSITGLISGTDDITVDFTTYYFTVRAYTITGLSDRTFSISIDTAVPVEFITPAGLLGTFNTGQFLFTAIPGFTVPIPNGIQIEYTQFGDCTVSLLLGSLPPGITIDSTGLISGFVLTPDILSWHQTFTFTLEVTNGKYSALRTFSIGVYDLAVLTADTTMITADSTTWTADISSLAAPSISTYPQNINTLIGDYFAFQFEGFDLNDEILHYYTSLVSPVPGTYPDTLFPELSTLYSTTLQIPSGLTLDLVSGWLYGRISTQPTGVYTFGIYNTTTILPTSSSDIQYYTITVSTASSPKVRWLSPTGVIYPQVGTIDLGSINNGAVSTFQVFAEPIYSTTVLQYQLPVGSTLPTGLTLNTDGTISGRVDFTLPTAVWTFSINAYSTDGLISDTRVFTIIVDHFFTVEYNNLWMQAMPEPEQLFALSLLLQDTDIFTDQVVYRPNDPNFGVATKVVYWHCYGLNADTDLQYYTAMQLNHYNKQLYLGDLKVAQALDSNGNILYEVVYSQIIDNLVNNDGVSINKQVFLPYSVDVPPPTIVAFPNSLDDMRQQMIDTIGQVPEAQWTLPTWMTCTQADGNILGFTPAWVIAYCKPGFGNEVQYKIQQWLYNNSMFYNVGSVVINPDYVRGSLDWVNFEADRYNIDRSVWNGADSYVLFPKTDILR